MQRIVAGVCLPELFDGHLLEVLAIIGLLEVTLESILIGQLAGWTHGEAESLVWNHELLGALLDDLQLLHGFESEVLNDLPLVDRSFFVHLDTQLLFGFLYLRLGLRLRLRFGRDEGILNRIP